MAGGHKHSKGFWNAAEDRVLTDFVKEHGIGKWNRIAKATGLKRSGKSCRQRWMNYLSPDVKRGDFSPEEQDLIVRLHNLLGNRWSLIAGRIPGRTDSQVKNYWNAHLSKKVDVNNGKTKVCATPKTVINEQENTTSKCGTGLEYKDEDEDEGEELVQVSPCNHEVIMSDDFGSTVQRA